MKKNKIKRDQIGPIIFKIDKDIHKLKKQEDKTIEKDKPIKKENIFFRILTAIKTFLIKKNFIKSSTFFKKMHTKKTIEEFNYIFYESNIQKIRESFPEYIYKIYNSLNNLKMLFKELFIKEKNIDYYNDIFLFYFIDNLLIKEDKQVLDSMDIEYFKNIASDENKGTKTLEEDLCKLKERIIENNELAIYHYTSYFEKLIQILDFDFISFFKTFDPGFKEHNYSPKFQPIFGKLDLDKIKNLDSFLKIIDFDSIPENVLLHFNESINALKTSIENKLTKKDTKNKLEIAPKTFLKTIESVNRKDIEELHKTIYNLNKKKIIEALIRLVSHDFEYVSPAKTPKEKYIFKKYIKLTLEKKRFIYLKTYMDVEFALMKQKLLNFLNLSSEEQLPTVNNYNHKTNEKLAERGCYGFKNILLVILYKSFYELLYKDEISRTIKKLLIEGNFINRHEHSLFSTVYYNLSKTNDQFINFATEVGEGEKDMGQILRFAWGEISDPNFLVIVSKKIVEVDYNFKKIIQEGLKSYNKILFYIKWCINDWKKQNPTLLSNARIIGSSGNRTLFNSTVKASEKLENLIKIINSIPQLSSLLKSDN